MSDLGSQLREYIDGIAKPVAQDERVPMRDLSMVRPKRSRRRSVAIAIGVVTLIVLVVTTALVLRSERRTISPATGPGVALAAKGAADCSFAKAEVSPKASLLVAVQVLDHHTICISRNLGYQSIRAFFDNKQHSVSVGVSHLSTGLNFFGIDGTVRGRPVFVGTLPDTAHGARLTFCNGRSVEVPALNSRPQRFFAVAIDKGYGIPAVEGLDAKGNPASGANGPLSGTGPSGQSCSAN